VFDFLEEDILKEFGGLENVAKLVRYPDVQKRISRMKREHLKVIRFVNEYISEKLPNTDYILSEIVAEYFYERKDYNNNTILHANSQALYSAVAEYISRQPENMPKEVKDKIFNIITNSSIYNRMSIEMFVVKGKEITADDIENIDEIKDEFCDKIIRGEIKETSFSVRDAYLLKYYNLNVNEAIEKVSEYTKFIEELEDTPENLPLKKYIFSLYNVLESNPEFLSIAYSLSKNAEPINRIEIEKIEATIKEKITKELKESLFKTDEGKIGTTTVVLEDGKEATVDVYEAKDDFNMLVTVLDAYGGANGVYENYQEQWNTNKYAQNQRICTTYIANNSLKIVKRNNCIIYGFTEFENSALVKMAPYDIVSKNDELVTTSARDAICMGPKELINQTRRYNEIDIERTGKDGKKIQPSYIVCFAKNIDEVNEESKKAAAQFGIPIVFIDREKCAERETQKIDEALRRFIEEKDASLIDNIVEQFCNNKYTSNTIERDLKEAREQGRENDLVNIDEKYFSDERFVEILQTLIDVAKSEESVGHIDKSKEILLAIKDAVEKESEKHILWQEKFGIMEPYSPLAAKNFENVLEQVYNYKEEKTLQFKKEAKEKLDFISRIDGSKNNIELGKREEEFRTDSYSMKEVQEKILSFSSQDLDIVCDNTYKNLTISNMYVLMIGKECGLNDKQIEIIIESLSMEFHQQDHQQEIEGYTEEENEILRNLKDIDSLSRDTLSIIIDLLENPIENKMTQNKSITNEIFEACVSSGIIDKEEIDLETMSLEEKIEILKNATSYEVYKVVDSLRMNSLDDVVKQDKLWSIELYFSINMARSNKVFKYIQNLPKEKQKEFILMAKVQEDASALGFVAEQDSKCIKQKLYIEESAKYLPTVFQIQEAFANQRLDEIIDKEGLGDKKDKVKTKLAEKYEGKSPIEYAYKLNRFMKKKKVNEIGEHSEER